MVSICATSIPRSVKINKLLQNLKWGQTDTQTHVEMYTNYIVTPNCNFVILTKEGRLKLVELEEHFLY